MTRLLIGYDGSDGASAAITATGTLFPGAEVLVATVHPPSPSLESAGIARIALPDATIREGIERMREDAHERASAMAKEGAALAETAGLHATPSVLTGLSAWRQLRAEATRADVDGVVCGTQGEGALERLVLGSTASSLLHNADRPLLVVPPDAASLDRPWLAGYDGSDSARAVLRFVAAHQRDRPLVVAHAWRSPLRHSLRGKVLARSGVETFEDYIETVDTIYVEMAQQTAEDGAEYARGLGLTASGIAPESNRGDWRTLLAAARESTASAILVGSRGRGAVASTVLGSVASGLVNAAELPVLVVPSN
jgi:nucleotide-binding universal stress UspA family protein